MASPQTTTTTTPKADGDLLVYDGALTATEIPKMPLYVAFGLVFGVAPMLPTRYNAKLVWVVGNVYKRVGGLGLLAIPFFTLAGEKSAYDTYCAYHGRSIYEDSEKSDKPPPQFPSGGSQLPSLSWIETRRRVGDPCVLRSPPLQAALDAFMKGPTSRAEAAAARDAASRY